MRVSNIFQIPQPNFKQVNLIQISKKAFEDPEVSSQCSKEFGKALQKATGRGFFLGHFVENLLVTLGLGGKKTSKIYTQLESRSYSMCDELLEGAGYSIEWLERNTGTKLKKPLDENMHSFYVLTKEHKDGVLPALKWTNISKIMLHYIKEGTLKFPQDNDMSDFYACAKAGEKLDQQFDEVIEESQIHKFKLKNLDELKNIADKLGI